MISFDVQVANGQLVRFICDPDRPLLSYFHFHFPPLCLSHFTITLVLMLIYSCPVANLTTAHLFAADF